MKGILGIDPGLTGGMALITSEGVLCEAMPTIEGHLDLSALSAWRQNALAALDDEPEKEG